MNNPKSRNAKRVGGSVQRLVSRQSRRQLKIIVAYADAATMADVLRRARCSFDGETNGKRTIYNAYVG